MRKIMPIALYLILSLGSISATAGLELQKVTDQVYAIVGELSQRSPENLGNNATFGLIVTNAGLVLVDPGGSEQGAAAIHALIKGVSDQPVKWVINTGGQDHRWLGNHYWAERGASIIASSAAVADQKNRSGGQLGTLQQLVGEAGMAGTSPRYADQLFENELALELGGVQLLIRHLGAAHTPGDSFVYLPQQNVLFSGDIIYLERMLGVGSQSNSKSWLAVLEAIAELNPEWVIPGHGHAAGFDKAQRDTIDYLRTLRQRVAEFLDEGGALEEIGQVDQSEFDYLEVSDQLAGRNAHQVFQEMEFEF
ncbi:MAG: MBL fold metallo-hydrolase [Sedimenticola sp.]|jgi:glyoxylase-like metal-dependent hydrolase (beta-lactamase superfamily II)|nr:MAG: MBL fold metallo-hydrolase [Sedimenticola sp.]